MDNRIIALAMRLHSKLRLKRTSKSWISMSQSVIHFQAWRHREIRFLRARRSSDACWSPIVIPALFLKVKQPLLPQRPAHLLCGRSLHASGTRNNVLRRTKNSMGRKLSVDTWRFFARWESVRTAGRINVVACPGRFFELCKHLCREENNSSEYDSGYPTKIKLTLDLETVRRRTTDFSPSYKNKHTKEQCGGKSGRGNIFITLRE